MTPMKHVFLDADDTLWENEIYYREAKRRFALLLSSYAQEEKVMEIFNGFQEENIPVFGYGAKTCMTGFTDTAADLCGGNIPGTIYSSIKEICKDLFWHEVKIIDGVTDTLEALSGRFSLVVATKGDMMEQERKFRESGLEKYFSGFEVMQDKDERNYSALARKYGLSPSGIVMAGNSVRSDIVPVVSVGGTAIHVPHELVWEHEAMDMPQSDRVIEVQSIRDLVTLLCS